MSITKKKIRAIIKQAKKSFKKSKGVSADSPLDEQMKRMLKPYKKSDVVSMFNFISQCLEALNTIDQTYQYKIYYVLERILHQMYVSRIKAINRADEQTGQADFSRILSSMRDVKSLNAFTEGYFNLVLSHPDPLELSAAYDQLLLRLRYSTPENRETWFIILACFQAPMAVFQSFANQRLREFNLASPRLYLDAYETLYAREDRQLLLTELAIRFTCIHRPKDLAEFSQAQWGAYIRQMQAQALAVPVMRQQAVMAVGLFPHQRAAGPEDEGFEDENDQAHGLA